tara:strand:- start:30 stop:671 length:642 start_codon:yes stop_codon:yes gene_type:complete
MNKSNILCHRGLWSKKNSQNSFQSLKKAFAEGFSIETDIRDCNSKLVISHDPPNNIDKLISFESILDLYNTLNCENQTIGINIKSDGIGEQIKKSLLDYNIKNYFTFDMSLPETIKYINLDLTFLSRMSEYESSPVFSDLSSGFWLDTFKNEWYSDSVLKNIFSFNKKICFVSSELHNRDYKKQWHMIKKYLPNNKIYLCTDHPYKAKEYFND